MSHMTLEDQIKRINDDIDNLLELEGVSVHVIDEGFLPLGKAPDADASLSVVFEGSISSASRSTICRLEVVIKLNRCIYGINRRRETVITLGVDVPADFPQSDMSVELLHISNAICKLTQMCARGLSDASSMMANDSCDDKGLYKLVSGFYWYLQDTVISHSSTAPPRSANDGSSLHQRSYQSLDDMSRQTSTDPSFMGWSSSSTSMDCSPHNHRKPLDACPAQRRDSHAFHKVMAAHSRYYREFEQEKVLGSGSFGCVTKVRRNGISYAVKQIPIYKNYGTTLHEEAVVLASLQHRNIVRYYDAWMEDPYDEMMVKEVTMQANNLGANLHLSVRPNEVSMSIGEHGGNADPVSKGFRITSASPRKVRFPKRQYSVNRVPRRRKREDKPIKYLYILMEYCAEENLFDAVCDMRLLESPQLVVELFRQILEALSYIHEKGIIHRDIKPSNIFLKSEGDELSIKLGDFGLTAKLSQDSTTRVAGCPTGVVGTLHYMSPEQARGDPYDEKVDIFAAGVVLFEMLSPPFSTAMERFDVLSSFSTAEKKWPNEFQSRVDNRILKILESMLNVDPFKRPSASHLLQSEIFASSKLDTCTLYRVVTQYPHSMESTQLLSSIFGRRESFEKELVYFDGMCEDSAETNYVNVELARRFAQEFESRGAIRYQAPLFVDHVSDGFPDTKDNDPYMLLLTDGRTCQLRTSLLPALAECIPQSFLVIMRRWYWGKAYHKGQSAGHYPLNYWRCAYDIVADYSILLQEMDPTEEVLDAFFCAELMLVAVRPLLKFMACNVTIEWTYSNFIRRVLEDGIGIRDNWSFDLENLIMENHKRAGVLKQKLTEYLRVVSVPGLSAEGLLTCIIQFVNALPVGSTASLSEILASISRILSSHGRDLSRFNVFMSSLMYMESFLTIKDCDFVFVPLGFPSWHRSRYSKFSFCINYVLGKKHFASLITGGCVNSLLPHRNGTMFDPPHRNVFGFEVNLQPLIQHFNQQEAFILGRRRIASLQLGYHLFPQVLICISHLNLLPHAMVLEHWLHKAGIIVEKQLGFPSSMRKLRKHLIGGLVNLMRLEIMVNIKYSSGGTSANASAAVSGSSESERTGNAIQYKVVYTYLGNEVVLNDEKDVLCVVCPHIYKRYL
ncbi:putative Ser/Thr protein kinase [Babesia divergens]|uniref:Ser/Thr protein kinase n=1 Tax=Babesia divergens TaxID=32595 RepID=A0AAD9GJI5_BABDI|nr:putative Ser/Thr protein kinase [Babesia divergens]